MDTYLVVQNTSEGLSRSFKKELEDLKVKVIVDDQKTIAKSCGVYATPQIALIDINKKLYYKGKLLIDNAEES